MAVKRKSGTDPDRKKGTEKATSKAFEKSRSELRGAVSRYTSVRTGNLVLREKSRRPVIPFDAVRELRRNLQVVLGNARARLPIHEFEPFLRYFDESVDGLIQDDQDGHDDNLQGFFVIPALGLETELVWLAKRLNHVEDLLARHVSHLQTIETAFARNGATAALSTLDGAIRELWSGPIKLIA